MEVSITSIVQVLIRKVQHRAAAVSCAGAVGTATPGTAALQTAARPYPATETTSSASASPAPQDRANEKRNEGEIERKLPAP